MGRKIPGKKHKGVKDPEKQRAKRLSELETKVNAPPRNIDEQEIPKSLERLIRLKNAVKEGKFDTQKKRNRKRSKGDKLIKLGAEQLRPLHPRAKPEKIVPIFDQRPGESYERFYRRISRETEAFVKESQFEAKYNVEVKRDPASGRIEGVEKRPKNETDKIDELRVKHKNVAKKKKTTLDAEGKPTRLSKSQKRRLKLVEKKRKKEDEWEQEEALDFDRFKDKVDFGEVVHAPPELKLPRLSEKIEKKEKNKNLLLSSIIQNNDSTKTINRTGKRKDLPIGERRQLEKQQKDVIAAYRQLKARKFGDSAITA